MKKTLIIILSIVSVVMLSFDGWWIYLWKFAPDKQVSTTYEVGLQQLTDGSDTKYFAEINYYSNANKNGLECFEVKFNYLLDENKTAFYSQGIQIVGNQTTSKIGFNFIPDSELFDKRSEVGWYKGKDYYNRMGYYTTNSATGYYNYMSGDDYETTLISTNPISNDSMFKIAIGDGDNEQILGMKFKHKDNSAGRTWSQFCNEDNYIGTWNGDYHFWLVFGYQDIVSHYSYYDINYLVKLLYDSVQTLPSGTNTTTLFEFGNIFDYYTEGDNVGVYDRIVDDVKNSKITNDIKSYYSLKVNVSADGMRRAKNDSMFNCIAGNCNYNSTGNYLDVEYFYGRAVIDVDETDFALVPTDVINHFKLKLSNKFINYYQNYSDKIVLNVVIDETYFDELGVVIDGFINTAFDGFVVFQNNLEGVV